MLIDWWTCQSWTLQKRFWILKSSFSRRWAGLSTYWIWWWRWSVLRQKWIDKWNWDWDAFNKVSNRINAKLKNVKRTKETRFFSGQLNKSNCWRNKSKFFWKWISNDRSLQWRIIKRRTKDFGNKNWSTRMEARNWLSV